MHVRMCLACLSVVLPDCQLNLMWQTGRLTISVTGTRCPRLPGACTLMRSHTPCVKCSSNRCIQLQIIPSGQIYVFKDEQVAVEAKPNKPVIS